MKFIKNTTIKLIWVLFTTTAISQSYTQLKLSKHSINNGSNVMSANGYEVRVSIGQVDASAPASEGHGASNFSLNPGFWHPNTDLIFKNKF